MNIQITERIKEEILSVLGKKEPEESASVRVYSAITLDESEKKKISQKVSKLFGQSLTFSYQTDPSLLGGLKIVFGDRVIDLTITHKLRKIEEEILKKS